MYSEYIGGEALKRLFREFIFPDDDQLIGVTTAREIYKIIMVKLGIEDEDNIAAFMRDRASVNDVAMDRLSGDFQCSEDIKCFSHTLDHVGDKFKCETLTRFWGKWLNLFSHSRRAKKIFNQVVGVSVKSYSATQSMNFLSN